MESYKRFASIYDKLINDDINYRSWADKILTICRELNISMDSYLDLACGTGNITELLAENFKEVWGVDLSEDMLIEADEKLRSKRIRARFVCQDMTELKLNKKFNLITCCLDSLNYITGIDELKDCLAAVRNHMVEGGLFIFDINSHYKLVEVLGNNTFTFNSEDVVYIWENFCEDEIVNMFLTFFVRNGDCYERFEEEHSEKAYREDEIETALESCGLKIVVKLDNYGSGDVLNTTERICYVVTKSS